MDHSQETTEPALSRCLDAAEDLSRLLAAGARGDAQAFARLYRLTSRRLRAVLLVMLRREDLVQDALQDVFLSAWQHAGQYSASRGSVIAWLARIARNRALDGLARDVHEPLPLDPSLLESLTDGAPAPDAQAMRREEASQLLLCLQRLKPMQRVCVSLAYGEGLSHRDVAARLEVPLGSAKAWIRRGMADLRRCAACGTLGGWPPEGIAVGDRRADSTRKAASRPARRGAACVRLELRPTVAGPGRER